MSEGGSALDAELADGIEKISEAQRLASQGEGLMAERILNAVANSGNLILGAIAAGQLGLLMHQRGDADRAVEWYELCVNSGHQASGSMAAFNLALIYESRGRFGDAERALLTSIEYGDALADQLQTLGQENPADEARVRLQQLRDRR